MSADLTVGGDHGPAVVHHQRFVGTQIDHGFDRKTPASLDTTAGTRNPIIGNLRFFVKAATHTMTTEIFDDPIAKRLHVAFHCVTDVSDTIAETCRIDSRVKTAARALDKLRHLFGLRTDLYRNRAISDVTFESGTAIDAHDIAVLNHA